MKSDKNILVAFLLNISFSIFEFVGGVLTNSVAIISDAVHDVGDSLSIGIAFLLEKKSKKKPDDTYTYGYSRYSVLAALISSSILLVGSTLVIGSSINRIINPAKVNYNGMIIFALFGVLVNFLAAYSTRDGDSINQKAVNLHMLEDVLGWLVVLFGAILMRFTNISILDPLLSMGVSVYILFNVIKHFKHILDLFLEKAPENISVEDIKNHVMEIEDVIEIHHIHIWSIDGINNYATMHVVSKNKNSNLKSEIRHKLNDCGISHVTIELEGENEFCSDEECHIDINVVKHHHHH
ncbi:MAG: cation transporter [Bacilli bacterium]|nr:cation transporter [Bacilli bacterium]